MASVILDWAMCIGLKPTHALCCKRCVAAMPPLFHPYTQGSVQLDALTNCGDDDDDGGDDDDVAVDDDDGDD